MTQVYGDCRVCDICHIRTAKFEKVYEDGDKVYHSSCYNMVKRKEALRDRNVLAVPNARWTH